MCKTDFTRISFKKFLEICCNPRDPCYEKAWYEFDRRYRKLIFSRVSKVINTREDVREVVELVLERLLKDDFKALRNFRSDSERIFLGFLCVISKNMAIAYSLRKKKFAELSMDPAEEPETDLRLLHERLVELLSNIQKNTRKSRYNKQRDTLVFVLTKLSGFKSKEVADIPFLNVTAHAVELIVSRLKEKLYPKLDALL